MTKRLIKQYDDHAALMKQIKAVAAITPLPTSPTPTNDQITAKINAILAALKS